MADASSATPPPQQEQPAQSASFGAAWSESDAAFLQPEVVPLPKVHRAWERQPQSPFKRDGKYRKVWKRYELRSEPNPRSSAANMEKKSPTKSPRKIVKKRALDATADPTATPGRRVPKNKAFAATRWETPRRNSGRIASRKIAQPIFLRDPSPELTYAEASGYTTENNNADDGPRKDAEDIVQDGQPLEILQDQSRPIALELPETAATLASDLEPVTCAAAELDGVAGSQPGLTTSEGVFPRPALNGGDEPPTTAMTEESGHDLKDVEAPVVHGIRYQSPEAIYLAPESPAAVAAPVSDYVLEDEGLDVVKKDDNEDEKVKQVQLQTDMVEHPAPSPSDHTQVARDIEVEAIDDQSEGAEAVTNAAKTDQTAHSCPGTQLSEPLIQRDGGKEQTDGLARQILQVDVSGTILEADGHAALQGGEHADKHVSPVDETQSGATAREGDPDTSLEQLLQTDAAQNRRSDSASDQEDDASMSEQEVDDLEHLEEDESVLLEVVENDEDDALNIPSPSLSGAESPRFSSIADTLTLHLPDRTPPKTRTTKEIIDEPTSPVDEDTAFLKDFLSRADASKASREAAASQLGAAAKRRESDRIRQAFATARLALGSKDPDSPSAASGVSPLWEDKGKGSENAPSIITPDGKNFDNSDITSDLTLDPQPAEGSTNAARSKSMTTSTATLKPQSNRRSSRARQTRLPTTPSAASATAAGPNRIRFRGGGGAAPVVLKPRSDAQELAIATRVNTRKNKGGAFAAPIRLDQLKAERLLKSADFSDSTEKDEEREVELPVYADPRIEVWQASRLRWDSQLAYFQEQGNLAGLTSLSDNESEDNDIACEPVKTPELETQSQTAQANEEEGDVEVSSSSSSRKRKIKSAEDSSSGSRATTTPARAKRAKGLGAGNGTPAKGLLAHSNLPPSVEPAQTDQKTGKIDDEVARGKERSSSGGKKARALPKVSSGSAVFKGGKKTTASSIKAAQPAEPAASSQPEGQPDGPVPATSVTPASTLQIPPPPPPPPPSQPLSQLPTPAASRRSRLQTPRKVKLPVPVSSAFPSSSTITTPASASAAVVTASPARITATTAATPSNPAGSLMGTTPRKMTGITKPNSGASASSSGPTSTARGLSAGGRRRAAAATAAAAGPGRRG